MTLAGVGQCMLEFIMDQSVRQWLILPSRAFECSTGVPAGNLRQPKCASTKSLLHDPDVGAYAECAEGMASNLHVSSARIPQRKRVLNLT